ncbi:MAG TPA: glycogen debranching protein GlgX [Humibacter sp.]|nr:glycogen debranching protein GlgX [Humibacter sp.]
MLTTVERMNPSASPTADPMNGLGVHTGVEGGTIGVWSHAADAIELCLFDNDLSTPTATVPLTRGDRNVWGGTHPDLRNGTRYALRVDGPDDPQNAFDPHLLLIDPYARGVVQAPDGGWRSVVVDTGFDWGNSRKPQTPRDATVLYEAHVKGLTALNPAVPPELRGTYAGAAHPATIEYLLSLGVTALELLPVQAFASEQRLTSTGRANYWGYNTLDFFAPHAPYATAAAQQQGPDAVLREFKGMVRLLHEAGLEVILDVVYNHTAEEGRQGPTTSLRGIDNAAYYRQNADGTYIDYTGCGNTVDFGHPAACRLALDSLRYWASDLQIDGFRFDLAVSLARNADGDYTADHPLLYAALDDRRLHDVKLIAEPWDVGPNGWQTGNFPNGWSEWNDRYRDGVRTFWLRDIADARTNGHPPVGIGQLATRLAGSANRFSPDRGPVASVNFVTAHDGFTLHDLVSYDSKHNLDNGEDNRDGTDDNRSFNHGVEGPTDDEAILKTRRRASRNLIATLLLSAGMPMITAGDEFGRTQNGNNNAYCHDDDVTWLHWDWQDWQADLHRTTQRLLRLRAENAALRPVRYGKFGETIPSATQMDWYDGSGATMSQDDWQSPTSRTLQYLAATTHEFEPLNRILLVVHGLETDVEVTLPAHQGVTGYTRLWDSALEEAPDVDESSRSGSADEHAPGSTVSVHGTSMQLYRAHG